LEELEILEEILRLWFYVVILFVLRRHPERSEGSLYFVFAVAFARS
jgi:prolipoprotein diacylglyceryltransferase